jgi:hypothetical protein
LGQLKSTDNLLPGLSVAASDEGKYSDGDEQWKFRMKKLREEK